MADDEDEEVEEEEEPLSGQADFLCRYLFSSGF